jgi:hypothetical protein
MLFDDRRDACPTLSISEINLLFRLLSDLLMPGLFSDAKSLTYRQSQKLPYPKEFLKKMGTSIRGGIKQKIILFFSCFIDAFLAGSVAL